MSTTTIRSLLCCAVLGCFSGAAWAQDGTNVLVVLNEASEVSGRVAAHYARLRNIPAENIVRLRTDASDDITRAQYEGEIERPIGDWLNRHAAQDRILYIVLTKGIPLRIRGTSGRRGTTSSVDSELTLLYRRLTGTRETSVGPVPNPYYRGTRPLAESKPFSHLDHDIYLVSRLDGFTEAGIDHVFSAVLQELGLTMSTLAQPVRVALTGSTVSPGIHEVIAVLGKERTLRRLQSALQRLETRSL